MVDEQGAMLERLEPLGLMELVGGVQLGADDSARDQGLEQEMVDAEVCLVLVDVVKDVLLAIL